MANWHLVANIEDIDEEDVIQVDVDGRILAIYHSQGDFYATDGICTHAEACLADGFVMDGFIECPLHQGRFEISTGKAKSAPASEDLRTFEIRLEGSKIFVSLE